MRNDLQGLMVVAGEIIVIPAGLSEAEAYLWSKEIERREDAAAYLAEADGEQEETPTGRPSSRRGRLR